MCDKMLMMDNKAFDSKRIAEGYAQRPWLHKSVIETVKKDLGISEDFKFKNGLDVGCGAGLSSKALRLICDKVTGTDISDEMIKICKELYNDRYYTFYTAKAEETQIPKEKYDIVTAAGCINWIDKDRFLRNIKAVTSNDAMIIIYDFGITDRMCGNPGYTEWYKDEYLIGFPKPPRNEKKWSQTDLPSGFIMKKQADLEMEYEFDIDTFTDFMMIQSNVNSRIERGDISEKDVRAWLERTLGPVFDRRTRKPVFSGYIWYINRV